MYGYFVFSFLPVTIYFLYCSYISFYFFYLSSLQLQTQPLPYISIIHLLLTLIHLKVMLYDVYLLSFFSWYLIISISDVYYHSLYRLLFYDTHISLLSFLFFFFFHKITCPRCSSRQLLLLRYSRL